MGTSPIVMRINALLAEKGISKNQFYKDCKITSASFSLWNTGKTFPRENSLQRIADYLDTTTDYLRTGYGAKQVSAVADPDDQPFPSHFYQTFLSLCRERKMSPTAVAKEAGISSGAPTAWKKGAVPKPEQRRRLCVFFGVSDEYLLGYGEKSPAAEDRDGLDELDMELMARLKQLTPSEWAKVDAFVQGLLASR